MKLDVVAINSAVKVDFSVSMAGPGSSLPWRIAVPAGFNKIKPVSFDVASRPSARGTSSPVSQIPSALRSNKLRQIRLRRFCLYQGCEFLTADDRLGDLAAMNEEPRWREAR
ncbi:hypothetical protein LZK73_32260 (plasmid) [Neorhizobium galegae]|nr:hypothetical protein LZK73_32260 [Neorhizobium galegae]